MKIITRIIPILLLIISVAGPFATPARAQDYGYLWQLKFDFEHDFNGILTIQVGPWENGDLVSVDETSTVRVVCNRVGAVFLNGGDAVFNGGHLECEMDLAQIVSNNHGLGIDQIDNYGSIIMSSRLSSNAANIAPIFSHPDATYSIDFTTNNTVKPTQELQNNAGALAHSFAGIPGSRMNTYTYKYECVWLGACDATFSVGPLTHNMPTGGDRTEFQTDPQTFYIGYDGMNTFSGRMSNLFIDPGNSVH